MRDIIHPSTSASIQYLNAFRDCLILLTWITHDLSICCHFFKRNGFKLKAKAGVIRSYFAARNHKHKRKMVTYATHRVYLILVTRYKHILVD